MKKLRITNTNYQQFLFAFLIVAIALLITGYSCATIAEKADNEAALAQMAKWMDTLSDGDTPVEFYERFDSYEAPPRQQPGLLTASYICFGISAALIVAAGVTMLIYNNCPHCGASRGRSGWRYDYCRSCGEKIG